MPVPLASVSQLISTKIFREAKLLPQPVWDIFKSDQRNSNIIYSHMLKAVNSRPKEDEVWIVCTTDDKVDFVLSCTRHAMGNYPIFIYSAQSTPVLTVSFVRPRVERLATTLHECVSVERVFSVFAVDVVSEAFADVWCRITHIGFYKRPYYAASFTYCTTQSLGSKHRQFTMLPGMSYDLRPAVREDIPAVAKLCYDFAAEAEPFVLSEKQAIEEATLLISQNQLWVHTIQRDGEVDSHIASIVAVTRESPSVAAITKVFTNRDFRSKRCAERLVRKVVQTLLKRKDSVVLYVAHNNPAASKVYNRVGFVGLDKSSLHVDGVDSWLELGFERDFVTLGHW
ncbi:hypothetical protein H0H92_002124 [Tricholoma furcatifolium]|nr:hypothetical protein H0H92_002124 [Tricholoma furcatifolium]